MDRISGLITRSRRLTASIGLLLILAACGGATATPSTSPLRSAAATALSSVDPADMADVPMYRMDPSHAGVQPGPAPAGTPQLVWSGERAWRMPLP